MPRLLVVISALTMLLGGAHVARQTLNPLPDAEVFTEASSVSIAPIELVATAKESSSAERGEDAQADSIFHARTSFFRGTIVDVRPFANDAGAILVGYEPITLLVIRVSEVVRRNTLGFDAGDEVTFAVPETAKSYQMFFEKEIGFLLMSHRSQLGPYMWLFPVGC